MQQHTRLTEEDRSNLVAFLDGELPDEEAQEMEAKLARSLSARKEVEALEKTWTMLDWLPRTEAPADFTDQTISRIHSQQMRAERIEGRLKWLSLLSGKAIGWAACVAAAVAIGFVGVRYVWPDPSRGLIEDLEIVDNMDLYREVPDIKFLDNLSLLTIFAPAVGDEAAAGKSGAEAPADGAAAPAHPPPAAPTTK